MMKSLSIALILLSFISFSEAKSQDYARHLELSLLFYECQRSGPLPKDNRIYWRHDSMVDAGEDVGLDLSGGYYDAGDNVKFNFPQAGAITLVAWSAIDFADGYKKAGQYKNVLDMIKWGTDYFIKCHPSKDELYITIGNGTLDHSYWYPPEYMTYAYPSYKVDKEHPGSEVAGEFAASLAAASILFKEEDLEYSDLLLRHAIEIYDFADKYRGSYSQSVPLVGNFYGSGYYYDELAWGALWLYRATLNEKYREKFETIASTEKGYDSFNIPISWADKYPGVYVLAAQLFDEPKYMIQAQKYTQLLLEQPTTPGGLYYCSVSRWGANRHAANAAATTAFLARILAKNNPKRQEYIDFVQKQINYMLGDNPLGINYVVGAEENSPKSVHHRGSSYTYDSHGIPSFNIYTLWGALAGGPGEKDDYVDDRTDYVKNEVALDYNAGFTAALAGLVSFGLGKKDSKELLDFDRAWPKKAPIPDIRIEMKSRNIKISTGSGMQCGQFCVYFFSESKLVEFSKDISAIKTDGPYYILCNGLKNGFLDGKGNTQSLNFTIEDDEDFQPTKEFTVLCDGFYARKEGEEPAFRPDYGHMYHVVSPGGRERTLPLFEDVDCWPSSICKKEEEKEENNSWDESIEKAKKYVKNLNLTEKINLLFGTENQKSSIQAITTDDKEFLCVGLLDPFKSKNGKVDFKGNCFQDGPAGIRFANGSSISWQAAINTAATFNKDLIYDVGYAQGEEAKIRGINTYLSPCVNMVRSPQAGRLWEGFGEDPYLSGVAAVQMIKGIQDAGVIATVKHFVGNDQEFKRMTSSSNIKMQALMDIYVEPFYRAVKDGNVGSVMAAYNALNGIHCHESKFLLTEILRGILDFKGFVVSDWWSVKNNSPDSLNNGLDLNMPGGKAWGYGGIGRENSYWSNFEENVINGDISEERVNEAVTRVIASMYQLNQFDNFPSVDLYRDTKTENNKLIQRKAATESQVLLKNDGILPIWKNVTKIAVIGNDAFPRDCNNGDTDMECKNATNHVVIGHVPLGFGSGTTTFGYLVPPIKGIKNLAKEKGIEIIESGKLNLTRVGTLITEAKEEFEEGAKAAEEADIAIVFVKAVSGESYLSVENVREGDRMDLDLWHGGNELIEIVAKNNPNTIVVINAPCVVNMPWLDKVRAVIFSGFPGAESGNAIADILFGVVNPSGHLPYVWAPLEDYNVIITSNMAEYVDGLFQVNYTEGLYIGQRYFNKEKKKPTFPFGYGLSYTKFEYSGLSTSMSKEGLKATFYVSNIGKVRGKAVPMLFITFPDSIGDYPAYILKGFEKVDLKPGEVKKVTILADDHALSYFNVKENNYVRVNKGIIKVSIAENGDPKQSILNAEVNASY